MISSFRKTSIKWAALVVSLTFLAGCSSFAGPTAKNTSTEGSVQNQTTVSIGQPRSTQNNFPADVGKVAQTKEDTKKLVPDNPSASTAIIDPDLERMLKEAKDYPSKYPGFSIACDGKNISWIRGDANYTGKPHGQVGNTNFGADNNLADKALIAEDVKPGSVIELHAGDVQGLNMPAYNILLFDKSRKVDQLVSYPSNNNQNTVPGKARITVPEKAGEYLFLCDVNWGKGDNEITYWFKIKVS